MNTTNPHLDAAMRLGADINDLYAQAEQSRKAAVQPLLQHLAASGAVSLIFVRGYTPGFNDGEPCTHSHECWVNIEALTDIYSERDDDDEDKDAERDDGLDNLGFMKDIQADSHYDRQKRSQHANLAARAHNRELCSKHGHVYDSPPDEVISAIEAILAATLDEDLDTDYWASYTLVNGAFVRDQGSYNVGY